MLKAGLGQGLTAGRARRAPTPCERVAAPSQLWAGARGCWASSVTGDTKIVETG